MSGLIIVLFAAALVCSSANSGAVPYPSYYPRLYDSYRNYVQTPVVPLTSMVPGAVAPLTNAAVPSFMDYAIAASLGLGPYNYPYLFNYPYSGSYSSRYMVKK